ncbi:TetR/AcrR family transcriptional regulator [Myxococcota bacterium]|nr:TetR/AcrR family transcriptional regulator [Myxococcota bacterium]
MGRRKRTTAELNWKRTQIIEAAARVFVDEGYHGATMGAIASASGYSAATLYTYFANKEDLFKGVMDHLGKEMIMLLEVPLPLDISIKESLSITLHRLEDFANKNHQLLLTYFVQSDVSRPNTESIDVKEAFIDHYATIFEEGMTRGEIRADVPPIKLALAFDGMTQALGVQQLLAGAPLCDTLDLIIDLFLQGATPRP